jgi:hypothetical protein
MGYCYERLPSGHYSLCCDACGAVRARRRACPHKVDGLPYCPAPALCKACYQKHKTTLHAPCEEPARLRQLECDQERKRLSMGEKRVLTAWGDWHETVPKGMVGFRVTGEVYYLVPKSEYHAGWLGDYPNAKPWEKHA